MKISRKFYIMALVAAISAQAIASITTANFRKGRVEDSFQVSMDIVLDSLNLGRNQQLYITPVIQNGDNRLALPTVLVNGRSMHYGYLRGTVPPSPNYQTISTEVQCRNGQKQSVPYTASAPIKSWMLQPQAAITLVYDSCGCGIPTGSSQGPETLIDLNPASKMRLVQITPPVTAQPVTVHEGRARVQFEVDKTELHTTPYTCHSGQKIDNRAQLAIIDDSVKYALSDPNVEIASISVTGYASPESPYTHNDWLATNRSKALADYLADRYKLPAEASAYSAVPENWKEFREIVVAATDITEQQRKDLLALIDAPAYGPSDYDAKEQTLKKDPRFAQLYRSKILPEWFPRLRATQFAISTRLKPMSDENLAKIITTQPQLMSLNQMFRVARLYPEGSDDFDRVIDIALQYYPESEIANLNAAVTAIHRGDFATARRLLEKAGDSPEADNARGVLAVQDGNFTLARQYFEKAGALPEAVRNKEMLY